MKQYCLTFLKRGLLAASGGPLILAMIYGILGANGQVTSLAPGEVCMGIVTVTLLAFIAAGIGLSDRASAAALRYGNSRRSAVSGLSADLPAEQLDTPELGIYRHLHSVLCGGLRPDLGNYPAFHPAQNQSYQPPSAGRKMMRKPFLDNLRYGIVLSVAVYHVFYQFNSVGIITNVLIPGIPALDAPLYVLYPWFMAALFMISGICARYSLEKQTGKQYLKGKVRRQLIPSIAIIFLIGWSTGWVTDQYANIFGGGQVPGFAKYLVWCMSGIGVLWFLHELLLCEVVLVLIRKLDKKDRLWQLGGKANFPVICLLVLGMWGSAYILNTPVIEVYRNGFYLFCFLVGYILFSHEQIQSLLAKWAPCMLAVSGVLAVVYTVHFWGQNYAALNNLKSPLTNLYAWFACLGALGAGKRWLDKETAFTRCMASRSFGIYVLHNPLLVLLAWGMDKLLHFPVWSMYLLLPVLLALLLPPLIALIKRIPVLRTLVLGEK